MGPRCSSAETQVCHRSYIIAAIICQNHKFLLPIKICVTHKKLSDMIDALIKRVSVTYKCYEMYVHQEKKVQLLVF